MALEAVKVSGSNLDRVVRCNASAALPQIVDQNESPARDTGSAVHDFLEVVPEVGREAALAQVDERWREACERIELAKIAAQLKLTRELPLAYNWEEDTSRVLQRDDAGRVHVDRSCEVAVIIDVTGQNGKTVYVGDYKTGHGWLPPPEESNQLGLGALAAARLCGATSAKVEYLRIRDDGSVRPFAASLDQFALDAGAHRVNQTMTRVRELRELILGGHVPNVYEGPWCKHCPARQHCPAKTALIRHLITDPEPIPYVLPLTPTGASEVYRMLHRAKAGLNQLESALYAYAKTTPIPLGVDEDGSERYFGELIREGNENVDGRIAHEVVTEEFNGAVANSVVTMEATKKSINAAIRKNMAAKPGETIKAVSARVYDKIKKLGGLPRKITDKPTEYTIQPGGDVRARKKGS